MCYQKQEQQYSNAKKKKLILQAERTMTCCSFIEHNNLVFNPPQKKPPHAAFSMASFSLASFSLVFSMASLFALNLTVITFLNSLWLLFIMQTRDFFFGFFFYQNCKVQALQQQHMAEGLSNNSFFFFYFFFCFENCPKETFGSIAAVGKKDTAE